MWRRRSLLGVGDSSHGDGRRSRRRRRVRKACVLSGEVYRGSRQVANVGATRVRGFPPTAWPSLTVRSRGGTMARRAAVTDAGRCRRARGSASVRRVDVGRVRMRMRMGERGRTGVRVCVRVRVRACVCVSGREHRGSCRADVLGRVDAAVGGAVRVSLSAAAGATGRARGRRVSRTGLAARPGARGTPPRRAWWRREGVRACVRDTPCVDGAAACAGP